jgi:hypothetical protein
MALGSIQPLTEMSTRNLPGGKERPARKADNLTAIYEPIVEIMWDPRRLTTLWASMACYRDSFTLPPPNSICQYSCGGKRVANCAVLLPQCSCLYLYASASGIDNSAVSFCRVGDFTSHSGGVRDDETTAGL